MLERLICSVNIELNDRDSSPRKRQQSSCLLPRPERLWSYPTFYPTGTQGSVHRGYSGQGLKPNTHTHPVSKFKNVSSYPPIHTRIYFLLVKHNVQFVFSIEPIFREVSPSNWAPPPPPPQYLPLAYFPVFPTSRQVTLFTTMLILINTYLEKQRAFWAGWQRPQGLGRNYSRLYEGHLRPTPKSMWLFSVAYVKLSYGKMIK